MTPKQTAYYWREWNKLRLRCQREQWTLPERHELHRRALGRDRSSKDFSNAEFDKVLAEFATYTGPADLQRQRRQQRQPRTRLEYRITVEQAAMLAVLDAFLEHDRAIASPEFITVEDYSGAEHYILELMKPRFGTEDIQQVSDVPVAGRVDEKSDLECLRDTLDARITALRQKAVAKTGQRSEESGWSWHDLRMRAGVPCDCATFCRKLSKAGQARLDAITGELLGSEVAV